MELKKGKNIGWVDLLRILACFLVVFSHCCDPFVAQFNNDRHSFVTGVFCGSLVRPCVPLFVMMTGVLLFPVCRELGAFYKKRIGRIIVPLIFWSVALPLMFLAYMNFIPATHSPSLDQANYTLENAWNKIYTFVFNFNYDTTPLWYLYMLLGLYFIIPIFSSWMEHASKRELKLFLFVWGISLVLPYIKMIAPLVGYAGNYGNKGILGVCDWNDYGTFYYVSGFIGYLVLARYLVKYPLTWDWKKTLIITVPMFLAGYAITALGFLLTQEYFPGNYAYLEIIWYFAGINVFMMTFPVFVIVQKLPVRSSAFLSGLASLTFGIYLSHFVFVQMGYDFFDAYCPLPVWLRIIGMACVTFIISAALVWVMKQFKVTRRLVM